MDLVVTCNINIWLAMKRIPNLVVTRGSATPDLSGSHLKFYTNNQPPVERGGKFTNQLLFSNNLEDTLVNLFRNAFIGHIILVITLFWLF